MLYSNIERIRKIRKMIELIAYGSLALDFAIAIVTLVSVNAYIRNFSISEILFGLNVALTVEVILTSILFLALLFLSHYEKIIDGFVDLRFKIRNRIRK